MGTLKDALFAVVSRLLTLTLWVVAGGMLVLGAVSILIFFGNVAIVAGRSVLGA
ncbi:hypothetical protein [Aliiruegeria lutimaris]|uniref:Uncharacterized protein n=1 Tax=Aliiruegeria lutimaris TaxID=571298 RepID=A0A1G8IZT1_9RHOB|nr:hypothetical protein [Aliiruegeria lutimaris]SDI23960.1 hypothetical protein SAMN04488026_1001166 [Aliiruegeria lutimaris]